MRHSDFWLRVAIGEAGACWPWLGAVDTRGYGNLRLGGRGCRAHRVAYELAVAPIPAGDGHHGTVVMHACDNRLCCNPAHLALGTQRENIHDMERKGRRGSRAGAGNGRAVLSPADVCAIRADERGTRVIAKDYPVSRAAIQRIKAAKAWSCLAP